MEECVQSKATRLVRHMPLAPSDARNSDFQRMVQAYERFDLECPLKEETLSGRERFQVGARPAFGHLSHHSCSARARPHLSRLTK